jgi:hypothetical protein
MKQRRQHTPPGDVERRLQAAGLGRLVGEASAIAGHWQVLAAMADLFDAPPVADDGDGAQGD